MRYSARRWIVALCAAVAAVVPAALAWACVGVASIVVEGASSVEPGSTIEVRARSFARGVPVEVRLDSLDGPVLATSDVTGSTMTSNFLIEIPLPSDLSDGEHVLLASQDHHDMNVGQPARAAIYVDAAPPAPPAPVERPQGMVANAGPSALILGLVVAGVAVAGLALAGMGRRVTAGA